jgi:hypothetical protein
MLLKKIEKKNIRGFLYFAKSLTRKYQTKRFYLDFKNNIIDSDIGNIMDSNWHQVCSRHLAKRSRDPKTFQQNESPAQEPNQTKLLIVEDLLQTIRKRKFVDDLLCNIGDNAFVYGGFLRDKHGDWKDIDIRFPTKESILAYIERLQQKYNTITTIGGYCSCFRLLVQNREYPELEVQIDATFETEFDNKGYDFDVNMLRTSSDLMKFDNVLSMNPNCKLSEILEHIEQRKFVVLAQNGKPLIKHNENQMNLIAIFDAEGNFVDCNVNKRWPYFKSECVNRRTRSGKKLVERIDKMKGRGWHCLNESCMNPTCISAPKWLFEAFIEKEKEKEEAARKKKIMLRNEQSYLRAMVRASYIPGFLPTKTGNRTSFETTVKSQKQDQEKKQIIKAKQNSNKWNIRSLGECSTKCSTECQTKCSTKCFTNCSTKCHTNCSTKCFTKCFTKSPTKSNQKTMHISVVSELQFEEEIRLEVEWQFEEETRSEVELESYLSLTKEIRTQIELQFDNSLSDRWSNVRHLMTYR